jgi:hypothetical protein
MGVMVICRVHLEEGTATATLTAMAMSMDQSAREEGLDMQMVIAGSREIPIERRSTHTVSKPGGKDWGAHSRENSNSNKSNDKTASAAS